MTCGYRLAGSPALGSRKQPTFLDRPLLVIARGPYLPPLPQQIEHLGREHDVAVLAALRLLHANDLLRAVDMLDLECRVRSLLANFGSRGRELSRHLKYIACP